MSSHSSRVKARRPSYLRPYAALKQPVIVAVEALGHGNTLRIEVFQRRPVPALLLHVPHVHLVDEAMPTLGRHLGLRSVCLVGAHVVVLQRGQHRLQPGLNLGRLVRGAVARQQKFQHEGGDIGALLDAVQEVLADDLAVKVFQQFQV